MLRKTFLQPMNDTNDSSDMRRMHKFHLAQKTRFILFSPLQNTLSALNINYARYLMFSGAACINICCPWSGLTLKINASAKLWNKCVQ